MITIYLSSVINLIEEGEPIWPFNEHENLHFEIEHDIHTSLKIIKKVQYIWYLMSLTICNYTMLYLFIAHLIFYQQMSNWLFGHYKTLKILLGKKKTSIIKDTTLCESKQ